MSAEEVSPPRVIGGSPGSRIWIELVEGRDEGGGSDGMTQDAGSPYILCLDHDDGNNQWVRVLSDVDGHESFKNKLMKVKKRKNKRYVARCVSMVHSDSSGWFIRAQYRHRDGHYCWWSELDSDFVEWAEGKEEGMEEKPNITTVAFRHKAWIAIDDSKPFRYKTGGPGSVPESLIEFVRELQAKNVPIQHICLSHELGDDYRDGWFVRYGESKTQTKWAGFRKELSLELKKGNALHVSSGSDGEWVVIRHQSFAASEYVSDKMRRQLDDFYEKQKQRVDKRNSERSQFYSQRKKLERKEPVQKEKKRPEKVHQSEQTDGNRKGPARKRQEQELRRSREKLPYRIQKELDRKVAQTDAKQQLDSFRSRLREKLPWHTKKQADGQQQQLCSGSETSEEFTAAAFKFAKEFGYSHIECGDPSVISFIGPEGNRLNVWPSTKTVGSALEHPKQGCTQQFRREVSIDGLRQIFKNPRVHLGTGYQRRDQIPTPARAA